MKQTKLWMLTAAILALCALRPATMLAQSGDLQDGVEIIHECDTTWHFGYNGINLYSRPMHRIDIAYPSVDAHGHAISLSGSIVIPGNVYDGSSPADGVLLYNRYTQMTPECCPSRGFAEGEFVFMCNPLNPNWIMVESDFYGFGVTSEHISDQYYVYGDANGHASIDCLIAARKVMDERGISQGKYLFNAGVSSGGYDCIATQRVRDMYHKDDIRFDKTLAAAAPFNVSQAYRVYIEQKDNPKEDFIFALIVVNAFNRQDNLGFTPQQMFTEPLASHFDEWFNTGRYNTTQLRDSLKKIGITTFADAIQPAFLDTSSDEFKTLNAAIKAHDLQNDWMPDPDQSYYYQHYAHDCAVPSKSGRELLDFLTMNSKHKKSLVPELTNLTTCMYILSDSHTISGIQFMLRLAATLTAYPVLYYDGELNTHYYDLVKVGTPMGIIKLLEEKGIDVAQAFNSLTGGGDDSGDGGGFDFFSLMTTLSKYDEMLHEQGTSLTEVMQIADDSGLSLADIMEIINYLNSKTAEQATGDAAAARAVRQRVNQQMVGDHYYNTLLDWLKENNVNMNELQIGL